MRRDPRFQIAVLPGDGIGPEVVGACLQVLDVHPEVVTTGVLRFPAGELEAGKRKLGLKIVGANSAAVPAYMVGLDWARWVPAAEAPTSEAP